MPDGTSLRLTSEGTEVLEMSNGDREIRTSSYKVCILEKNRDLLFFTSVANTKME